MKKEQSSASLSAAPQQHGQHDECEACGRRSPLQPAEYTQALDVLGNFNPGADEFTHAMEVLRQHQPQQPGQEVGEVERLRGQMEIVWRYLQKVSPWSASNDMLWCDEIMVGIDLLAQQVSQPQQPAEAVADIEDAARELLAQAESGPQNDYGLVHRRIAHQAIAAALRTTPPAIDIGKLRELVKEWRGKSRQMTLVSYTGATLDRCADELAALIGDSREKV